MSLAAALLLGMVASTAQAFCGFFAGKADASLFNEASQVVLARDGKRTMLSMQNDYKWPLREFALIVPTPTVLKQGQVRVAERATFERLDAYSSPRLAEYHDTDPCQVHFPRDQRAHELEPLLARMKAPRAMADSERRNKALGVTGRGRLHS